MKRLAMAALSALLMPAWVAGCDGVNGASNEPASVADAAPPAAVSASPGQTTGVMQSDPAGNQYGVTRSGGANDIGTIYRVDAQHKVTVLHSFDRANGRTPVGGLVSDAAGNLYGATRYGGVNDRGTVFRFDPVTSAHTVIHSFDDADGAEPLSRLTLGPDGALYGTTKSGGETGHGTVFKLDIAGAPLQSVIYSFAGGADGAPQDASVSFDADGHLYGATPDGGELGRGTLWRIDAGTTTKTTLFSFNAADELSDGTSAL